MTHAAVHYFKWERENRIASRAMQWMLLGSGTEVMNEHVVACLHRLRLHHLFLYMLSSTSPACTDGENVGERELFRLELRPEEKICPQRWNADYRESKFHQTEIESNVAVTKEKLRTQLNTWKIRFFGPQIQSFNRRRRAPALNSICRGKESEIWDAIAIGCGRFVPRSVAEGGMKICSADDKKNRRYYSDRESNQTPPYTPIFGRTSIQDSVLRSFIHLGGEWEKVGDISRLQQQQRGSISQLKETDDLQFHKSSPVGTGLDQPHLKGPEL